jgi:hypothetical protein
MFASPTGLGPENVCASEDQGEVNVSVSEIRRSRTNSRDYRLSKIHRVTKKADVENFALVI